MICNIIACGPSGKWWNGKGFSIGVNDCAKWGHQVDNLIVVNSLNSWPARKEIITETRPREELYGIGCWSHHPNYVPIPYMHQWKGRVEKGKLYKSKTSPFIAVSLAFSKGYDKIVLWGVDFDNHPMIWGEKMRREVENYLSLQGALLKKGASMYLGGTKTFTNNGVLAGSLPNFIMI